MAKKMTLHEKGLGESVRRMESQSCIDFLLSPEALHTVLWQELVRVLVGTTEIGLIAAVL